MKNRLDHKSPGPQPRTDLATPVLILAGGYALTWVAASFAWPVALGVSACMIGLLLWWLTGVQKRAWAAAAQTQSELRLNKEELGTVLENIQDYAVFTMDLDRRINSWNPGAEKVFGFTEAEVLGKPADVIFTPEDRERHVPDTEIKRAQTRGISEDDRWHQRKDGTLRFVSGLVRPMHDLSGRQIGFVKVARDVTEQKREGELIRREKQFSDTIINSLPGIFYLFNRAGRFIRWNGHTERMTGYSGEEISRMSPLDFFGSADKPKVAAAIQQAFEFGQAMIEADLLAKDGRVVPHLFFGRLLVLDESPCIMGMGVDISVRKRAEEELQAAQEQLRHYTTELESRVAERTAHLQQSIQSLEGVLYHVAHDLRAPLRSMASFTEILLEEYGKGFDERGQDYARRIQAAAGRMDELVRDILEYGHLAHSEAPLEKIELNHAVDAVLDQLGEDAAARGAEIRVERPLPTVLASRAILDRILSNLLCNALKFVAPDIPPRILIRAEDGAFVRLWVEDNGIGIRREYQDRIFGVFERLHPAQEYPGTGIGLAIVRKGMERLGGRAGVESEPGKGSRFWIELKPGRAGDAGAGRK